MTVKTAGYAVAVNGVFTFALMMAGLGAVASVFASLQLLFLVGSPLAIALKGELKLWAVIGVVAIALSIAITAMSVQSLIWFGWAKAPAIVAVATIYGMLIPWVLTSAGAGPGTLRGSGL